MSQLSDLRSLFFKRPDSKVEENMFSRLVELDRLRAKTRESEQTDLSGLGLKDPDRLQSLVCSVKLKR